MFLQMHEESRMSCLIAADARLVQAWSPRSCETVPGNQAMAMSQPGRSSSCCSSMLEARGGSSLAGRPLGMAGARRRGAERRNLSPTDAASAHESKERSVKEHALAMEGRSAGVVRRPFPITQTRVWLALILPRNLTMSAQDFRE